MKVTCLGCESRIPSLCPSCVTLQDHLWCTGWVLVAGTLLHHQSSQKYASRGNLSWARRQVLQMCDVFGVLFQLKEADFFLFLISLEGKKGPLKCNDIFSLPVSSSASSWHFALPYRRKLYKIMWDVVKSTSICKIKADKILESCSANWWNCLATFFSKMPEA